MTLSIDDRKILIRRNIEKHDTMLDEIELCINTDRLFTAVNRIYYGLYYILAAVALQEGFSTSKHMRLISWFNKTFIQKKVIDQKYGKMVRKIFEQRSKADYDVLSSFSREQVEHLFTDMKETADALKRLIKE